MRGQVTGHLQSAGREHILGAGGQVVQAGPDVLTVVVALLLIKGGLGARALECGLELQQLCLSQEVLLALIQEVDKSAYHTEWGMGCVDWQEEERCQD